MSDDLREIPGVGPAIASELAEKGFETYQEVAFAAPDELSEGTRMSSSSAGDIIDAAREACGWLQAGEDFMNKVVPIDRLATGHTDFDALIGGGIETRCLTECYGNEGTGRTAIAHLLAVRAQLPSEHGGLDGRVAYVDTRKMFDPNRIGDIVSGLSEAEKTALADKYDIDSDDEETLSEAVLENIYISSPSTSMSQIADVHQLSEMADNMDSTGNPLCLVCVDALMYHFCGEYQESGRLAKRQQLLDKHLHDLDLIGDVHQQYKADTPTLAVGEEADTRPSVQRLSNLTPYPLIVTGSHKRCQSWAARQPAPKVGVVDP